jgi:hypothetical protein
LITEEVIVMKFTIAVRHRSRPSRPALADLAGIPDPSVRRLALVEPNRLLDAELADVYHPIGAPFWNVWLSHRLVPGGEHIRLEDWCQRYAALREVNQPGGGAA